MPAERALTIYVDKKEVVTLMTLGAHPEWLTLGYLLNQRLVESVSEVDSVTVDWEVGASAVRTRSSVTRLERPAASRVVTTGCGQGSMFSDLLDRLEPLPQDSRKLLRSTLGRVVDAVRKQNTLYKTAGSVHACALFDGEDLRLFVEDVGRHNALDTLAGWRALESRPESQALLYTTGRLTSEMIIKAAQMGVPFVISRSGTTEMAIEVAQRIGVCAIGRALHNRFICYTHPWRIEFDS